MLVADHPAPQSAIRAAIGEETAAAGRSTGSGRAGASSRGLVERVVLESLRLYPPTWLLVRTAAKSVSVAGYDFPAGHHFMVSPYVLHRNPTTFPDPEAFWPDRWVTMPRFPAGYLPFGGGLHVCPGRHLATTILAALLRTVVGSRRVVRMPGAVGLDPRTTLLPDGLRLGLRPLAAGLRSRVSLPDGEPLPSCLT
jgi:cytochrome P450